MLKFSWRFSFDKGMFIIIIWQLNTHSSHTKTELCNLFAGWYHARSINQGRRHREVNSSTPSKYFLLMVTQLTLWLLHYCRPFETQDDWNFLSLVSSPQCYNSHPCMYSYSRISNSTNPCLGHHALAAVCCAAVMAAAQQCWRPPIGTACHNFQHSAPHCSPVNWNKCQVWYLGKGASRPGHYPEDFVFSKKQAVCAQGSLFMHIKHL
jgi:hypothetical protein